MNYSDLKKYFDSKNSTMSFDFRVRIHRALSWGQAAEKEERLDEKLIKYWISFNALYGSGFTEFSEVEKFLGIVISVDKDNVPIYIPRYQSDFTIDEKCNFYVSKRFSLKKR